MKVTINGGYRKPLFFIPCNSVKGDDRKVTFKKKKR